jgi:hypothetical protein
MTAHRTKGWVAMQRKEYEPAEKEFREVLKANGNNAEASFWLATVMLAQKNPDKQSEALFHFARAAAYEGPGALPPPQRQKVLEYIKKTYTSFHGDDPQGFQQLLDTAKAQTFPPQDFKILSEAEVLHQKEEELKKTNPQLAFWMLLKQALTAPTGDDYFNSGVKGALLPPADQPPLKGFVISQEPARAPKTVVLGMTNSANPEVTIEFEEPLPTRADPGTTIEFRGVAKAFTREPFMLTFDVERDNLTGWPSPQRKAPGRKAVKKK